ncbi:L-lactate dehydrogenase complex protein LldG [Deinobacterium chartae]|uniref:L-lactate dehydrogenase complex protein LldG n=1 Tax=Deinobacterium chartae TaxID=521158 RepID=A0A841I348_9DEIO|nr:lactate utilization protein C [Deinobacterium chartae]MBB6099713.1 L-lactate dehydrogenase complex protein LldG [Deinobacterium chartae]
MSDSDRFEARMEILARIRRADAAADTPLTRAAFVSDARERREVVEQFAEFAGEYRASVTRTDERDLPETVRTILARRGSVHVVIPADLPARTLPADLKVLRDEALDTAALDAVQAVVTTCAVAVAETGTVVLDHGAGQGRRALTLLPDHHVCIIRESQVVGSVPEAVARLQTSVAQGRPLTWISGPSATSDIELSRVEGVHGPRVLDLVLVRTEAADDPEP